MGTDSSADNSSGIYDNSTPPPLQPIPGRPDNRNWKPRASCPDNRNWKPRASCHLRGTFTFNGEDFPALDDPIKKNKEQRRHRERKQPTPFESHPAPVPITCRACSASLKSSDFSNTQMKQDSPRCNNCIKNAGQSSFSCESPKVGSEVRFTAQRACALSFQFPSFIDHNSWLSSFHFAHRFGATIIVVKL